MVPKKAKPKKRATRRKAEMTPEQERNALIFRLRGFHANAKTLPFHAKELAAILDQVDLALIRLGATSQSEYLRLK